MVKRKTTTRRSANRRKETRRSFSMPVIHWRQVALAVLLPVALVAAAVAGLIGRGQGLTPSGDDALAGVLLVTHARGGEPALAAAVRAQLARTTAISAALLDAAAQGYASRIVVDLVDAAVADRHEVVASLRPRVLGIGHTSGHDLLTGVQAALEALAAPVLRHRILINYRAEAEGVSVEKIIDRLLETVKGIGPAVKAK